ncbi:MAG TPA: carboxypeptidase regulatory-like domain-containing protein [Candidatus Ozemobacteraceae bacterium]|nr:carboxypeptidase regulatory-like domain-containing protein [Candidatus Ozemobacteraceae bacterium]
MNLPVDLLVGDTPVTNSVLTTGEGQFIFQGLAPALYSVRVGHGSATFTEVIYPVYLKSNGTQSPLELTIPIETKVSNSSDNPGTIEAYIVDSVTNTPIILANVKLHQYTNGQWSTEPIAQTVSNGNGYIVFDKDANHYMKGLYKLVITKEGYDDKSGEYPVNIQSDGSMTPKSPRIQLIKTVSEVVVKGSITGYVKLDISNEPLMGVKVTISGNKSQITQSRNTTVEGKFAFDDLTVDEYTLNFTHTDYENATTTIFLRSSGIADPEVATIKLTRKRMDTIDSSIIASGSVHDSFTGGPLEFVTCKLNGIGSVISDSRGGFSFIIPKTDGNYTLSFSKLGYQDVSTTFKVSGGSIQNLPLKYEMLYNQEVGKGSIVGRLVRDPGKYDTDAAFTADLANAVVRVYEMKMITKYYSGWTASASTFIINDNELWGFDSLTPIPVKSANIVTSRSDDPPFTYGTFKISHLSPTVSDLKYFVFIGKNSTSMATESINIQYANGESSFFRLINNWTDWKSSDPNCLQGWKLIDVSPNTSTYLTNFEDNR